MSCWHSASGGVSSVSCMPYRLEPTVHTSFCPRLLNSGLICEPAFCFPMWPMRRHSSPGSGWAVGRLGAHNLLSRGAEAHFRAPCMTLLVVCTRIQTVGTSQRSVQQEKKRRSEDNSSGHPFGCLYFCVYSTDCLALLH
jgi:hypothetical protein